MAGASIVTFRPSWSVTVNGKAGVGVFVMVVVVVFVTVVVLVTVVVSVFAEHPMALNIINADNKMEERIFAIFLILIPPIKTGFMMSVNVYFQGIISICQYYKKYL